jgi:ABC-type uncharacterized transport system permease subunit
MKINKSARFVIDVFIFVIIIITFILELTRNILTGPLTVERIFSKDNIKETIIILVVASAIVVPIRM